MLPNRYGGGATIVTLQYLFLALEHRREFPGNMAITTLAMTDENEHLWVGTLPTAIPLPNTPWYPYYHDNNAGDHNHNTTHQISLNPARKRQERNRGFPSPVGCRKLFENILRHKHDDYTMGGGGDDSMDCCSKEQQQQHHQHQPSPDTILLKFNFVAGLKCLYHNLFLNCKLSTSESFGGVPIREKANGTLYMDGNNRVDVDMNQSPSITTLSSGSNSDGESLCKICFANTIDVCFLPCAHCVCCTRCLLHMIELTVMAETPYFYQKCTICNTKVDKCTRVIIS